MAPLEASFSKLAMAQFDPFSLFTEFPNWKFCWLFWQLDYLALKKPHSPTREQKEVVFSCYKRPSSFEGHVAALVRSHAIGLLPFRLTKEQTTQTMDPSPKTIELLHYPGQWNLELTGSCYSTEFRSRLTKENFGSLWQLEQVTVSWTAIVLPFFGLFN